MHANFSELSKAIDYIFRWEKRRDVQGGDFITLKFQGSLLSMLRLAEELERKNESENVGLWLGMLSDGSIQMELVFSNLEVTLEMEEPSAKDEIILYLSLETKQGPDRLELVDIEAPIDHKVFFYLYSLIHGMFGFDIVQALKDLSEKDPILLEEDETEDSEVSIRTVDLISKSKKIVVCKTKSCGKCFHKPNEYKFDHCNCGCPVCKLCKGLFTSHFLPEPSV